MKDLHTRLMFGAITVMGYFVSVLGVSSSDMRVNFMGGLIFGLALSQLVWREK